MTALELFEQDRKAGIFWNSGKYEFRTFTEADTAVCFHLRGFATVPSKHHGPTARAIGVCEGKVIAINNSPLNQALADRYGEGVEKNSDGKAVSVRRLKDGPVIGLISFVEQRESSKGKYDAFKFQAVSYTDLEQMPEKERVETLNALYL